MRMSKLVGRRVKETPKDASTASHIFLLRGGYARQVSAGIYTLLPLGFRVQSKVEAIIRDEMNRIDAQEILMPLVNPADIWEESGRYRSIGDELLRFHDRNDKNMVLAMTHEEAVCHMARTEITSYKQLPVSVYQIQTKYRDEARPRAGLIRVREFHMKDAYSFHDSQASLEETYARFYHAYERIFRRCGIHECISIESDTGMIGGSKAHEFMAVAECGEDTLFVSPCGQYKANREVAESPLAFSKQPCGPLEKVHTPGTHTIEQLADFLHISAAEIGKTVVYVDGDNNVYFVMIRGDIEVNEIKLKKLIGRADIKYANDEQIQSIGGEANLAGFLSPYQRTHPKLKLVLDPSVLETAPLVIGANERDYHYRNADLNRDLDISKALIGDIRTVRAGDPCPVTGAPLLEKRGIEVGNIFQLGTKYSKSMGVNYLDANGKAQPLIMGCYGIGAGRTVAAAIEQNHDDYGPIWPIEIAPYHVQLCVLNLNAENVRETAEKLYADALNAGIEILFDDRGEKAGFMFNDADLIGIPLRLILSPKTLAENKIEFKRRGEKEAALIDLDTAVSFIEGKIAELIAQNQ